MSETNGDLVSEIEPCSNHREKSPTQNAVSETKVSETSSCITPLSRANESTKRHVSFYLAENTTYAQCYGCVFSQKCNIVSYIVHGYLGWIGGLIG